MKAGDEVITVPNTAVPTVSAIRTLGAKPVFVDVRDDDFLMDVDQVEAAITPRTTAIVPVHLYGQCVDLDPLMAVARRHGLKVMEDCAQSQGALYKNHQSGSVGTASAFSFYPTKVLGAYGDGGMVMSDDEAVIQLARSSCASTAWRPSIIPNGTATIRGSTRCRRRSCRSSCRGSMAGSNAAARSPHATSAAFAGSGARAAARKRATAATPIMLCGRAPGRPRRRAGAPGEARDINCNVSYRWPIHLMRGYADLGYREGQFPVAERKAQRIFSLPMYPHLQDEEVDEVIEVLRDVI